MDPYLYATVLFLAVQVAMRLIPRSSSFKILSTGWHPTHDRIGTVRINGRQLKVFKISGLWRFSDTEKVLPEEWQDKFPTT